jgi:putative ABC transport system permease protein
VNKREVTLSALEAGGYDALYIHEAASANSGTETAIIHALRVFLLVLEMLVLFFVSYFIMKLIFRSQNVYFSTIRMLGGNRRGCSGILLVDMLCVFHIAFGAAMAFLFMLKQNVILAEYSNAVVNKLREWMYYIMPKDALILYLIVLGLTVLLAVRYSRVMFKKTAMNAYKEEV